LVVAGGDEQLPGSVHADPGQGDQLRGDRADQGGQVGVEVVDLGLQRLPAAGQSPQRRLGRRGRAIQPAGAEAGADADPLLGGQPA
jgi:hypothetical protein